MSAPGAARAARVLIVSRLFAPEPGAATMRLGALRSELVARGHRVDVITTTPAPGRGVERSTTDAGGRIGRWPALRNRDGYVRGYLPYLSFDLPAFVRVVLARRPDVVVVEPPPTTGVVMRAAARLRRVPYIYYAADLWSVAASSTGAPLAVTTVLAALERCALHGAAAVLTVYPALVERMRRLAPRARVELVGHGADTRVFTPTGSPPDLARPYLVYAGTASEVHGATIFIDAFARVLEQVPDAHLVVIGQGEERPAMEQAAALLPPDAVTFLPRLEAADTAVWLRGARAALASVRPGPYEFALATKVYASAACGVPVVYVGGGEGAALVRENQLGEVVPYDVEAVTRALGAALRREVADDERTRLVSWARDSASLQAAAARAADAVERVAFRRRGGVGS